MRNHRETTTRDILRKIKDGEISFLDLKFVDLLGTLQHITFPVEVVDEETFLAGVGFDGSSVVGFQEINESDMILMPDPSSAFVDPFCDDPTLSVFCDIIDPNGHRPYTRDSRAVAKRAERYLKSLGIADKA